MEEEEFNYFEENEGKCEACGVLIGFGCCDDCPLFYEHPQDPKIAPPHLLRKG